jgi:hypothetical protein
LQKKIPPPHSAPKKNQSLFFLGGGGGSTKSINNLNTKSTTKVYQKQRKFLLKNGPEFVQVTFYFIFFTKQNSVKKVL